MSESKKSEIAFFYIDDDGWILGNDAARGPWTKNGCHGGPVAGILSRAAEQAVPNKQLVRITIDLCRPVPLDGFKINYFNTYDGRNISRGSLELRNKKDSLCAIATALFLPSEDIGSVRTTEIETLKFSEASAFSFPKIIASHGLPTFADHVKLASRGEFKNGPNTIWMKAPRLISNETPSAFQSICPLADCCNGFSRNEEVQSVSFINPDLSIQLHRAPISEWIGANFSSQWERTGIGLASALLFDDEGPIGSAQQIVFLQRQSKISHAPSEINLQNS